MLWDQPDECIWETRGGPKKFLYSQFMCWVAIERAIRLATRRGLPPDLERWPKARDRPADHGPRLRNLSTCPGHCWPAFTEWRLLSPGLSWDNTRKRWVASVTVGYSPDGRRIFKRARGRTKTEAQRKLKEIIREYEDGLVVAGYGYTVADAVSDWLAFGLSGRDTNTIIKCTILANWIAHRPCPWRAQAPRPLGGRHRQMAGRQGASPQHPLAAGGPVRPKARDHPSAGQR
jgi:Glycosyl hydrolases family 15/Arm DNA-binding domain